MSARLHPGVYVEEVPTSSRSVEGVSTSTAIVVGEAERGPLTPQRISSYEVFERLFGGSVLPSGERALLPLSVAAFFANGGTDLYVLRLAATGGLGLLAAKGSHNNTELLSAASGGAWGNGLKVRFGLSSDLDATRFSLVVSYRAPGASSDTVLERFDRLSLSATDAQAVGRVLERSAVLRWSGASTLGLADLPLPANSATSDVTLAGGVGGESSFAWTATDLKPLDAIDDAALLVAAPAKALGVSPDADQLPIWQLCSSYVEARPLGDLFFVADLPRSASSGAVDSATTQVIAAFDTLQSSSRVAAYWPFVRIADPAVSGASLMVPPSGFVAGLYARTDARRGVWKAPAGVDGQVLGVLGLEFKLLDVQQDRLNPRGINALRQLPGAGAVVWGARTTQPDSEWRYVPVRRTAIFLAESIRNSIQWAVFEPNSPALWQALRVTVEAFMSGLHRQGAFASTAASEAYLVRCDATTTTEADRLAGIVNVVVAFAPLRPAEFVVVKLSQKTALSA